MRASTRAHVAIAALFQVALVSIEAWRTSHVAVRTSHVRGSVANVKGDSVRPTFGIPNLLVVVQVELEARGTRLKH